ncbi:tricarballylate utilization 4Fe-4S protein TcuB [Ectothiorhodospira shaposhnikovii]|uniref:tricarballylate utilization 4Fe-4S protein TcuB n=1 Tax=Ectothiorhodospira shaposhnikovii TaxID=1054 RepID=UPI001EE813F7|nr:tricarballylate utilization 4Fe-4S protein TcuB [Ectothiorhodospira shaposhnikovii]MCG5513060.1 tricarballylate utilization 4Fe-4S protein TcuB [Ectothiorhodospira shaposhnikovii]
MPELSPPDSSTTLAEARRVMNLCNVCSYCTGYCAVFHASERRPDLTRDDLHYLANLCHNCRACWYACQYAPPHEFAINVPATLARVRHDSYRRYAWPRAFAALLARSGPATLMVSLVATLLIPLLTLILVPWDTLFAVHREAGAFYAVIPWGVMTTVALITLGTSVLALGIGVARFWRDIGRGAPPASSWWRALPRAAADLLTLRNLDGGGGGCNDVDGRFTQWRRGFHHALFYGFLLCLASTTVAAGYHHFLALEAPYPFFSLPVLLGTAGGVGMMAGTAGLVWVKRRGDPAPTAAETLPADYALLGLLFAVAATGLVLLALRETAAMGLLLALHLGTVLGFFLLVPYSKFVHGAYRGAALLRRAMEQHHGPGTGITAKE